MKLLTLLEVGNLGLTGLVIFIIAIILVVLLVISMFVAALIQIIYEWNNEKKIFTRAVLENGFDIDACWRADQWFCLWRNVKTVKNGFVDFNNNSSFYIRRNYFWNFIYSWKNY